MVDDRNIAVKEMIVVLLLSVSATDGNTNGRD